MDSKDRRIAELEALLAERDARIARLLLVIEKLSARIKELERRLGLNSSNSSRPPASDGLRKAAPQSLREKSGKPSGGQPGHPGHTLRQVAQPDRVITYTLDHCPRCGSALPPDAFTGVRKRQVFDIPAPRIEVTEHQVRMQRCPCCEAQVMAGFPAGVQAPVQYGEHTKALAVYLHQQQLIPEDRLQDLFWDVFALPVSTATLVANSVAFAAQVAPFTGAIAARLRSAPVKHLDESGLRVAGKLHWLHVLCNDQWTDYRVAEKRGALPEGLTGIVVHDHFKPYYTLAAVDHALCNAHHLRELKGIGEIDAEPWAGAMARLLRLACHLTHRGPVPPARSGRIGRLYDAIVERALFFHERQEPLPRATRGRQKHRPGHNLALRLRDFKDDVLRFLSGSDVPFTNNQAEQDLRMIKVQQKISGAFRTLVGAQVFATIRSFLSTMRKQGINLFEAIMHPERAYFATAGP